MSQGDPRAPEALPYIDRHSVVVGAAPHLVWGSLVHALERASGRRARAVVRLLGADPAAPGGRLPEVGATVPGFAVVTTAPGSRLELAGRHRFSQYGLVITLTAKPDGRTLLAAHTHARFPGLHGRAYRALVIGSRGHRVLVRRMLRSIAKAAEKQH